MKRATQGSIQPRLTLGQLLEVARTMRGQDFAPLQRVLLNPIRRNVFPKTILRVWRNR